MKHALVVLLAAAAAFVLLGRRGERDGGDRRLAIEFWTYSGGGSADATVRFWEKVARDFERAHPGVRVRAVTNIAHGQYLSVLTTRFIGGNPPDVFVLDDNMTPDLIREGLLLPLNRFVAADRSYHVADFPPTMLRDGCTGAVRYSIPLYGGYGCLFYRTDLLAQAGVAPPRTWSELVAVSRTLRVKLGMEYPFAMEPTAAFWMMPFIWQNGGDILSPDHRRVVIDTPPVVGAIAFVRDLMYRYRVMDPSLASGATLDALWSSGRVAMMINGGWSIGTSDVNFPQWRSRWEVAPLPAGKRDVGFYGGQHLMIAKASQHPELAWRFMVFATAPRRQLQWSDITGSPPSNLRVFDMPAFQRRHPHFVRMREAMLHGRNNPLAPFFNKIWYGRFQSRVLDVVMKDPRADIAAAVRAAAREMQAIVDDSWTVHPQRDGTTGAAPSCPVGARHARLLHNPEVTGRGGTRPLPSMFVGVGVGLPADPRRASGDAAS